MQPNDQSKEKSEPAFPELYPIQFWSARGKMAPHPRVSSNCNWVEANEVVIVVQHVLKLAEGTDYLTENGIGVATSYPGQVMVSLGKDNR